MISRLFFHPAIRVGLCLPSCWVYMYNDVGMTRYSLEAIETMLGLTGCVTLNNAFYIGKNSSAILVMVT